jgi:peptide/nickel transport system permease protein
MSLSRYIFNRILHGAFVVWLVASALFIVERLVPGGPARLVLGQRASDEEVSAFRAQHGLDQPMHTQYIDWMSDLLVLDLGTSFTTNEQITTLLMQTAPKTFSIALIGAVFGLAIGIPAGIVSATNKNQPTDHVATVSAFLGISMPPFFIGILLAIVFGVWTDLLPIVGYSSLLEEGVVAWLQSILLPGLAVGLPYAAILMRMVRSSLIETINQEYVQFANSKGMNERVIFYKHALPNALIPVVTIAGIQLALIISGSVTVELVFGIRGLGRLLVEAIFNRNYIVTQNVIMLVASIMILTNLIVDLTYGAINPKIKYGDEHE